MDRYNDVYIIPKAKKWFRKKPLFLCLLWIKKYAIFLAKQKLFIQKNTIMEKIKETVVEYLTKQIEIFKQLEVLNALSEAEKKVRATGLRSLMSQVHPYADEQKLKKILFSESQLEAFVLMVNLSVEAWKEENPTTKIVDSAGFVEKIIISVLNGIFNPSLKGAVKYV